MTPVKEAVPRGGGHGPMAVKQGLWGGGGGDGQYGHRDHMVIGTWPHWEHSPIEDVGTEMGTAPLLTAPFWGTAPLRTQGCGDRDGDSPTWGHSPTWGRSPIKDVGMGDQRWGQPCWGVQPHWGVTAPLGSGGQRRGCSPTGGTAPYGVAAPWGPPAGGRAPRGLTPPTPHSPPIPPTYLQHHLRRAEAAPPPPPSRPPSPSSPHPPHPPGRSPLGGAPVGCRARGGSPRPHIRFDHGFEGGAALPLGELIDEAGGHGGGAAVEAEEAVVIAERPRGPQGQSVGHRRVRPQRRRQEGQLRRQVCRAINATN